MNGLIRTMVLVLGGTVAATQAYAQNCPTCATGSCDAGAGRLALRDHLGNPPPSPTVLEMTGHSNTELIDRCWPERYSNLAQRGVNRAFAPQVLNGHVLDQTVWNHHFETGTDRLTQGGLAHLQYISRRRSEPDRTLYLATSNDLPYDPACPERYCGAKQELDSLRAMAVQKFMAGSNCGRCSDFRILVHDPADVTLHTQGVGRSVKLMYVQFRGSLSAGSSTSSTSSTSTVPTSGAPAGAPAGGAGGGSSSSTSSGTSSGGNP